MGWLCCVSDSGHLFLHKNNPKSHEEDSSNLLLITYLRTLLAKVRYVRVPIFTYVPSLTYGDIRSTLHGTFYKWEIWFFAVPFTAQWSMNRKSQDAQWIHEARYKNNSGYHWIKKLFSEEYGCKHRRKHYLFYTMVRFAFIFFQHIFVLICSSVKEWHPCNLVENYFSSSKSSAVKCKLAGCRLLLLFRIILGILEKQ